MKNLCFILLFLMTSIFGTTNMTNIEMFGMSTQQASTMEMNVNTEDCHSMLMNETTSTIYHDMMDCESCDQCDSICYNLSNNIVLNEAMSFQNRNISDIFHSKQQNFITTDYKNTPLRPPIF